MLTENQHLRKRKQDESPKGHGLGTGRFNAKKRKRVKERGDEANNRVKSSAPHKTPAWNDIYVTRTTPVGVYVDRMEKVLFKNDIPTGTALSSHHKADGERVVHVYALGAAIPHACLAVLLLQNRSHSLLDTESSSGSSIPISKARIPVEIVSIESYTQSVLDETVLALQTAFSEDQQWSTDPDILDQESCKQSEEGGDLPTTVSKGKRNKSAMHFILRAATV